MVHAVDITFSLHLLRSDASSSFELGDTSLGLLDPEVAIAKAVAAPEVLLLRFDCLKEVITTPALLGFWGESCWKLDRAVEQASPSCTDLLAV